MRRGRMKPDAKGDPRRVSISIHPLTLKKMRAFPQVNWSAVARAAFKAELAKQEASRSALEGEYGPETQHAP